MDVNMPAKSHMVAHITDNLRRIVQVVKEGSKAARRETGLTGAQLWAITLLAGSEPVTISELAHLMCLHPATMGGVLDRLENKALITRTRSPRDRRIVHVALTRKGKKSVDASPELVQGILVSGLTDLPAERLLNIAEGLEDLVQILAPQDIHSRGHWPPETDSPRACQSHNG